MNAIDCADLKQLGIEASGTYEIGRTIDSLQKVFCKNGWTVIMHRGQYGNPRVEAIL